MIKLISCIAFIVISGMTLQANNIQVSNIYSASTNTTLQYSMINCDISWDNSWRITGSAPDNWDAAWVFLKYRVGSTWYHATLNTSSANYAAPSGCSISAVSDGKGVFVYRSTDGSGTFNASSINLRWEYGLDGLAAGPASVDEFCVFAIEMVYVPRGSFYVGDGMATGNYSTGERGQFYTYPGMSSPYQITNNGSINVGTTAGYLNYYSNPTVPPNYVYSGDVSGPIPAEFPEGYEAFYCMKYEITQQQYVRFLNCLSYSQQAARTTFAPNFPAGSGALVNPNNYRSGIDIMTPGVASTTPAVYACNLDNDTDYDDPDDGQSVACVPISWADVAAYLDWTGLRPMTELEYEKACRGPLSPVGNEYPWGTTNIVGYTGNPALTNEGTVNEIAFDNTVNCNYDWSATSYVNGPIRVGAFARTGTNREQSGASYYGIMEMAGNVWERTVTVGNPEGRAYTGLHGDGEIDGSGNADVTYWPDNATAAGIGFKGGTNNSGWTARQDLYISGRRFCARTDPARGIQAFGGRGVRTAP